MITDILHVTFTCDFPGCIERIDLIATKRMGAILLARKMRWTVCYPHDEIPYVCKCPGHARLHTKVKP
jgi:hypothetical protein